MNRKQLINKIATDQEYFNQLKAELNRLAQELKANRGKLKTLNDTVEEIEVSDHALVRYLERFAGLDITQMKQEIANQVNPKVFKGKVPFKNGLFFYIDNAKILTISEDNYKKH